MKRLFTISFICFFFSCGKGPDSSIKMITEPDQQNSLFKNLIAVVNNEIPESLLSDSLAFLVLPVQASCPSCRKKTIDSIIQHQSNILHRHYVIITANGGIKTIRGYFREQSYDLPDINSHFFLDSSNKSHQYKLYEDNPTFFYSHDKKVYKKVAAIPATVREDLREFFSGHRSQNK